MDEWINMMYYIYRLEYYSAMQKEDNFSFATTWMELECIMLSEVSQREKGNYYMISFICGS